MYLVSFLFAVADGILFEGRILSQFLERTHQIFDILRVLRGTQRSRKTMVVKGGGQKLVLRIDIQGKTSHQLNHCI